MNIEQFTKIMQENNLCIRHIPLEVVNHWTLKDGDAPRQGFESYINERGRTIEIERRTPKFAGMFVCVRVNDTSSMANFGRLKDSRFCQTIEQAINACMMEATK